MWVRHRPRKPEETTKKDSYSYMSNMTSTKNMSNHLNLNLQKNSDLLNVIEIQKKAIENPYSKSPNRKLIELKK